MKEHKTQVLAALALALALGIAMPGAVFADGGDVVEGDNAGIEALAEGDEDGIETQAAEGENQEGDGAGEADDEKALGLTESIVELYDRINNSDTDSKFAGYQKSVDLIVNTQKIEKSVLLKDAETWAKETDCYSANGMAGELHTWLDTGTKTALAGKKVYQVIDALKADEEYTTNTGYKKIVDEVASEYDTLSKAELAQIKVAMPGLNVTENTDFAEMVNLVTSSATYAKYAALYNSQAFLWRAVNDGKVNAETLDAIYSDEDLQKNYLVMANAANAIDDAVMTGLDSSWKLPQTGPDEDKTDVKTPDTGIVGLFESGALDMTTLTLIASVAVASIAGIALIAKLYLKHKF